jgi:hypothetical protein
MEQSTVDAEPTRVGLGEDWAIVESLLPEHWQSQARELGAFRRARGIADARALLQVMLIHLAEGCGLRETATRAGLAGLAQVSDVALLKRLRSCGAWFEWLAQRLRQAPELQTTLCLEAQPLLPPRRLRVVDGSVISEPGPTGSKWRLHYAIGLPDLQCQEVHLGPSSEGETLKRFKVQAGDIFMADRGYAHPAGIAHVVDRAGDVIVRMNLVTLPLYEPLARGHGAVRLDILAHARTLQVGQVMGWPACVHPPPKSGAKTGQRAVRPPVVAGRLCAIRKSEAAAAKARDRVRRESQRNGTVLQPQTLEAAGYVFVFTTLPEQVSATQVLEIYRLRWQIELEFKRLKSLIALGHLKKHDAQAARSWMQGKLLVALLIARLIAHAERVSPWGYDISQIEHPSRAVPVA